ncbi:MAG: response regulator [Candidatus Latescibacteria bacterium]|jgi:signal transduction histidine kinase|nr:response regulator [Candidatus Latescibacterota bacterium]
MDDTILVVDDDEAARMMMGRIVRNMGYQVVEAISAQEALEIVNQKDIDLVVTDLRMPRVDGLVLAKTLLQLDSERPVLLVTGYGNMNNIKEALKIGVYDYFVKPVDIDDVEAGIRRALDYRRVVLENRFHQEDLEKKVVERSRKLQRAYEELTQTEKLSAVGRMAAGVVHEVLNPLTVVGGQIDLVMMQIELPEAQTASLKMARDELDRAVRIMRNLRGFSKQNTSKREAMLLNGLLDRVSQLLTFESRTKCVEIQMELKSLPPLYANEDQLTQVFLNLINNALEASSKGGVIRVESRVLVEHGETVVATQIVDSGVGIASADLPHLFEPFFTTKKEGTGLGLWICLGIVEAHGGHIKVESKEGTGTEFTITLPVLKTEHKMVPGEVKEHPVLDKVSV